MAGIGKPCTPGDLLHLKPRGGDQQLFRLAQPVGSQIFVSGAVEIPPEEPGEILGSYEYLSAQFFNGQREEIAAFNFFYYGQNIISVERFVRSAAMCRVRNLDQHTVAVDGELFYIQGPGDGYGYAFVYQPLISSPWAALVEIICRFPMI